MDDRAVAGAQIGRPPRSPVEVVARCPLSLPVVIAVPPLLADGTPFPTRFWLSCPLAVRRVSRVEAGGGIGEATALLAGDPRLAERQRAADDRTRDEREALIPTDYPGPRPVGGVAGTQGRGVKCLHAHYADQLAGNDNPVGQWTAPQIGGLNCTVPCVIDTAAGVISNPAWTEPH